MGLPSGRRLNRVYSAFFGCEVRFETDCCAVLFDPELVDRKLERGDATSHALCAEQRQRLLDKLDEGDNLVERVRQLIAGDITNMSALKSVADRLCMSPRSLRRKLQAAGSSYQRILDDARFALARDLLTRTDLPIEDIAIQLGYSEPGNFTHAFKRWYGRPPRAFRSVAERGPVDKAGPEKGKKGVGDN